METKHYLTTIYSGKVAERYGLETAIDKHIVKGSVYLSLEGLAGDECGDKIHHGGLERALHQYPAEHYSYWQEKYNETDHDDNGKKINWQAGGMGENLSTSGMMEDTVCLGDRYQWGEAIIEVSQPRSPCFKLNKRWGIKKLSVDVQNISRCGWLYRVIKPGIVSVDEPLVLISQVANAMTIKAVCETYFGDPLNREKLLILSQQSTLTSSWINTVKKRLASNEIENWSLRLLDQP